jgi:hypothetical protein
MTKELILPLVTDRSLAMRTRRAMSAKTIPEQGESRGWVSDGAKKDIRKKGLLTDTGDKRIQDNELQRTMHEVKNDQEDEFNRVNESALHHYSRHSD